MGGVRPIVTRRAVVAVVAPGRLRIGAISSGASPVDRLRLLMTSGSATWPLRWSRHPTWTRSPRGGRHRRTWYQAYSAGDVERLREVLAYLRLGFGLREIADLVSDPSADAVAHLCRLRGLLLEQRDRTDAMVTVIDRELTARAEGMAVPPGEQLGMLGTRLYDAIGGAYPATRHTDPRIAAQV